MTDSKLPQTKEDLAHLLNTTMDVLVKFDRNQTNSDERITLTILSELNGFATFIEKPIFESNNLQLKPKPDKSNQFLVITKKLNNFPPITTDKVWPIHAKLFSEYVGIKIDKEELQEAI